MPAYTNLVPNPSAEVNATDGGWTSPEGAISRVTTDGKFGTSCFKLHANITDPGVSMRNSNQRYSVTAGESYSAGVYVKGLAATVGRSGTLCWLDWYNSGGTRISTSSNGPGVTIDGTWGNRVVVENQVAPSGAVTAIVVCQFNGVAGEEILLDGWMLVQDVSLRNAAYNPSMEAGTTTGWGGTGSWQVKTVSNDPTNYAPKVGGSSMGWGGTLQASGDTYIAASSENIGGGSRIPVSAGQQVAARLSVTKPVTWPAGVSAELGFRFIWFNGSGSVIVDHEATSSQRVVNAVGDIVGIDTAPAGAVNLLIRAHWYGPAHDSWITTSSASFEIRFDAMLIIVGGAYTTATVPAYFDGANSLETQPVAGYYRTRWEGSANTTASRRTEGGLPAYFDGSYGGGSWTGTAHNSTSTATLATPGGDLTRWGVLC